MEGIFCWLKIFLGSTLGKNMGKNWKNAHFLKNQSHN